MPGISWIFPEKVLIVRMNKLNKLMKSQSIRILGIETFNEKSTKIHNKSTNFLNGCLPLQFNIAKVSHPFQVLIKTSDAEISQSVSNLPE